MNISLKYNFSCQSPQEVVGALNDLMPLLQKDIRKRLNYIKLSYLQKYGRQGLFERVNCKSIEIILAEFRESDSMNVIESGERDGIRYELFDAPHPIKDPLDSDDHR